MIKSIKIIDGCISCRNCETVCPNIFKVNKKSKIISEKFEGNEAEILQAELMCPTQIIKVEKKGDYTFSFKTATLKSKSFLTSNILELKFKTSNFKFKPGQYISLQMKDWKGKFSRSYSIVDGSKDSFTITVKLLKKGRGAKFLTKLKTHKKIDFLGALGNFYLQKTSKQKIFIATGTGLAPMIAMLKETDNKIEKTIIFGVRYESEIYYKKVLESFKNTKIIIKVSRPYKDFKGEKGRVTDCLSKISLDSEVYICGNPEMVDSTKEGLIDRGHPIDLIFNESFTVSQKYVGFWKDCIFNGNIPGINILSWLIILIGIVLISSLFNNISINLLWDISWWAVVFVMIIRPLADLFPKLGFLGKLVFLRKAFGILSASIITTALVYKFIGNHTFFYNYFSSTNWNGFYPFIGRLSEITGIILLITSNIFSQKILGIWWKRIQRTSYIYFISGGIIAGIYAPFKIYPIMGIVIILWILAQMNFKFWK